ncbi:hypothetical protein HPB50_007026 [Hyalomma asiaticum]|uniref:Uncharacterized protein n=1 Tax=Hyalomma asiaticum TaxID=266040 RepID=A0ACB7T5Y4_HYAAI|nr:hypothetical protein HPB50_007026 [Hyalomma asiaticum]
MYIDVVQKDIIHAYKTHHHGRNNLSRKESDALRALGNREDIVINLVDKGDAIVILNKSDYTKEGIRQPNYKHFYKPFESDPTTEHEEIVVTALQELARKGEIDP